MALSDYIPNVFGQAAPSYLQGLLGAEETQNLQNRANVQGLLGAGLALAQGMSRTGPRRSAAENILGALAGGFGAAGGAYEQGVKNFATQQQLALQARQMAGIQSMKMKYPDLAEEFDANPAGAFRLVAEREALAKKPTALSAGQALVSPTGQVIYQAPMDKKKNTAVVGNVLIDLDTGLPIYSAPTTQAKVLSADEAKALGLPPGIVYQQSTTGEVKPIEGTTAKTTGKVLTSQEAQALGLPSGIVYQQTATGEVKPVEGTGAKAPEVRDFTDGTTRQFDSQSNSWKVIARKPQGEGKSMYASTPTTDPTTGRLVFLPTRPGLPVVDAATGKPVDYVGKVATKPMPATLQKAEEEDFDNGQAAINLANDSQQALLNIANGNIKFGKLTGPSLKAQSMLGSSDPDVVARNDFERFKTRLINESLRLNKGTQTNFDAERAIKELESAESAADAGKAIQTLRDINARRAEDAKTSIVRRRTNAKAGDPDLNLEVPKFEPYVFTNADYANVKPGQTYVDAKGVRRIKGK
jgi:hypothetical protein